MITTEPKAMRACQLFLPQKLRKRRGGVLATKAGEEHCKENKLQTGAEGSKKAAGELE
jgi:hypothetical protein